MDADFYNNHQRFTKIQLLEEKVSKLEGEFKSAVASNKTIELKELMAQESTKELLSELRATKKNLEKLKLAMQDSLAEAKEEENGSG